MDASNKAKRRPGQGTALQSTAAAGDHDDQLTVGPAPRHNESPSADSSSRDEVVLTNADNAMSPAFMAAREQREPRQ